MQLCLEPPFIISSLLLMLTACHCCQLVMYSRGIKGVGVGVVAGCCDHFSQHLNKLSRVKKDRTYLRLKMQLHLEPPFIIVVVIECSHGGRSRLEQLQQPLVGRFEVLYSIDKVSVIAEYRNYQPLGKISVFSRNWPNPMNPAHGHRIVEGLFLLAHTHARRNGIPMIITTDPK